MPGYFVKFLLSETSDKYIEAALIDMKESPDRYTNALQTTPPPFTLSCLNSLATKYKTLLCLPWQNKDTRHLSHRLLETACTELLDQHGNLHPVIIQRFKIEETQASLRNSFLYGFAHHIFRELLNTDIFQIFWSKKMKSGDETFIHSKQAVDTAIRKHLAHPETMDLLVHLHLLKQEVFSTVGYDEPFIRLAHSDPSFLQSINLSAYIQTTSLKLLTAIDVAVRNVTQQKDFSSYSNYMHDMQEIINSMSKTISTLAFSAIETNIQAMRKMTCKAKSTTEKGEIFSFFKPTNEFIVTINKHLDTLFYILNVLHNNCHTAAQSSGSKSLCKKN
jgi:hypothetical protein